MDDSFVNLGEYKGGCAQRLFLKKKGSIPTLLWQSDASELATVSMFCYYFKYLLLTVQMRSFARNASCVCVRGTGSHDMSVQTELVLTAACVLQIQYEHHHCVCHATQFSFRAWTDKTILKAEARDYGKGRYISDACLWCSANHNALGQLTNQSRQHLSEGGAL